MMVPTFLLPSPPFYEHFFRYLKGARICLAWAYLLLFLTGNKNPGLSRERGKHP